MERREDGGMDKEEVQAIMDTAEPDTVAQYGTLRGRSHGPEIS